MEQSGVRPAGDRVRQEDRVDELLVDAEPVGRVAFPDGRRAADQAGYRRRRVLLHVGRQDAAVRAPERPPRAHARRTALTLFLRHRVLAERAAARPRGVGAGPHRVAHRRTAPVLLPLRPGERPVRRRRDESRADWRRADGRAAGHVHRPDAVARDAPAHGGPRVAVFMLSGFQLFPEQASTLAPEVDNLYLGVISITAFFAIIVVVSVTYFAIKYHDHTGDKVGAPITGSVPLELGWSLIPFFTAIGIFVWASVVFFHIVRAPDQTLEIYSTGKRWMWRFPPHCGPPRIQKDSPPLAPPPAPAFALEDLVAAPVSLPRQRE